MRGAIAHAASHGCAAATLREASAACQIRDAEATRTLLEAAAAESFSGAAYQAAFRRCASLDLGEPSHSMEPLLGALETPSCQACRQGKLLLQSAVPLSSGHYERLANVSLLSCVNLRFQYGKNNKKSCWTYQVLKDWKGVIIIIIIWVQIGVSGQACAAAAGVVAPRQASVRSQLSMKAATSSAAQLSGVMHSNLVPATLTFSGLTNKGLSFTFHMQLGHDAQDVFGYDPASGNHLVHVLGQSSINDVFDNVKLPVMQLQVFSRKQSSWA